MAHGEQPHRPTFGNASPEKHAESLYAYGAPVLDGYNLRCWIIQRLMLDCGLDHAAAERVWLDLPSRRNRRPAARPARQHRRHTRGLAARLR